MKSSLLICSVLSTMIILNSVQMYMAEKVAVRSVQSGGINQAILGYTREVLNKTIDIFLGVPYAKPPIGDLRFKRPQEPDKWSGNFPATKLPKSCYQEGVRDPDGFEGIEMWKPNTEVSEDCLYLNIWQPVDMSNKKKAIMVWIHGGGFSSGTSTLSTYDGRLLAAQGDVVVISVQYRLGPFGFLYLGSDEAPGNMGLEDIVFALKWIEKNGGTFGGDTRRITVFGESAGGSLANYLLISPKSSHLVNNAILMSGVSNTPWAFDEPSVAERRAIDFARKIGCRFSAVAQNKDSLLDEKSRKEISDCLRRSGAEHLSRTQWRVRDYDSCAIRTPFVPTIDGQLINVQPINATEQDAITRKSVMIGLVKNEGYIVLGLMDKKNFPYQNKSVTPLNEEEFKETLNKVFIVKNESVIDQIAMAYVTPSTFNESAGETDPNDYRAVLDHMLTDYHFKCPALKVATIYSLKSLPASGPKVYVYEYNHRSSANPWPQWMGAMHAYELDHVFGHPLPASSKYTDDERLFSQTIINYWTNFAKTGNPNLNEIPSENIGAGLKQWFEYKQDTRSVMHLDAEKITSVNTNLDEHCELWTRLSDQLQEVEELCHASASLVERNHMIALLMLLVSVLINFI